MSEPEPEPPKRLKRKALTVLVLVGTAGFAAKKVASRRGGDGARDYSGARSERAGRAGARGAGSLSAEAQGGPSPRSVRPSPGSGGMARLHGPALPAGGPAPCAMTTFGRTTARALPSSVGLQPLVSEFQRAGRDGAEEASRVGRLADPDGAAELPGAHAPYEEAIRQAGGYVGGLYLAGRPTCRKPGPTSA